MTLLKEARPTKNTFKSVATWAHPLNSLLCKFQKAYPSLGQRAETTIFVRDQKKNLKDHLDSERFQTVQHWNWPRVRSIRF